MKELTFKVRPTKEEDFNRIIKKFNRCLTASGMSEVFPIYRGKCTIEIKAGSSGVHYTVEGKEYTILLPEEIISMKGYRFIGEYRMIDKKWHRTMHSNDIRDEYDVNEMNLRCDHCGKNIKNRNGYFFFRDSENKLVVVGSTCVDAFLGFNVSNLLKALGDATEFNRVAGTADMDKEIISIGIDAFATLVSNATGGFCQWKKSSDIDSTSALLKNEIYSAFFNNGSIDVIDNASEVISCCRNYWNNQFSFTDLSVNSRKSLEGDFVPVRWAGIAGWAIYKAMSSNETVPAVTGSFVGENGQNMKKNLIPKRYFSYTNKWGDAYGVHFDDEEGNHYLTFTSSKKLIETVKKWIGKPAEFLFTIYGRETEKSKNINKIKSVCFSH